MIVCLSKYVVSIYNRSGQNLFQRRALLNFGFGPISFINFCQQKILYTYQDISLSKSHMGGGLQHKNMY
jgi:hypothetical protein